MIYNCMKLHANLIVFNNNDKSNIILKLIFIEYITYLYLSLFCIEFGLTVLKYSFRLICFVQKKCGLNIIYT